VLYFNENIRYNYFGIIAHVSIHRYYNTLEYRVRHIFQWKNRDN